MKQEYDTYLCTTFPKMFVNRYKPMTETTMCWGFECGNGWFTILDQLMSNIQHHIDWNNKNFEKGYKTPLPHTELGMYLKHYKAKGSKKVYKK